MSNSVVGKTWEPRAKSARVGSIALGFRPAPVAGVSWVREGAGIAGIRTMDAGDLDPSLMATEAVVPVEGRNRERLARLQPFLDGTHTVGALAAKLDWNVEECAGLVQGLYELGVLRDMARRPAPALSFYRHMVNIGRRETLHELVGSPLVARMLAGTLTERLVVGYLVEEYHLVASAASHISPMVAGAQTERLRMMFSDYMSGEYWHCLLLKKGLLAAGLTEEQIGAADPLPATLAVINLMRESSRTDPLAYSVWLSVMEGGDDKGAVAFSKMYDQLGTLVPAEVLLPSREHAVLDFEDEHETLGAEPFVDEGDIPGHRQDAIYRYVMASVRTHALQHQQIADFYGTEDGPLAHSYSGS
ncbi:iron-containing redox enzyme family protein [Pendulispora albinea]|uniref:Thiaminase-2/PQQC domain-containing protein n=1 Tax=Pendulispora albinea TaxID=2741071 RepID=A0ABZ2M1L6_9BACT